MDNSPDGAERWPRISFNATVDCEIESIRGVPTRKGNYTEFLFRVIASNSAEMPVGHMWSLFQAHSYEGAGTILKGAMASVLGHTLESAKAQGPNFLNEALKRAKQQDNPCRGMRVRATCHEKRPTKGNHVGKVFPEPRFSVYKEGAALPAAAPPAAPAAQQYQQPGPMPGAPPMGPPPGGFGLPPAPQQGPQPGAGYAHIPPHDLYRVPPSPQSPQGEVWQISTRTRVG